MNSAKNPKILIVGGGTGGHIVPAVTVAEKLLASGAVVEFWTDRKNHQNVVKMTTFLQESPPNPQNLHSTAKNSLEFLSPIQVRTVFSGKFRRYNWTLSEYFTNLKITLKDLIWGNLKGFCGFLAGLVQSLARLLPAKNRPDAIFLKGGFVGLPVGLVAGWLKIPYLLHESDATPGLANRLLLKKAALLATGLPVNPEIAKTGKNPHENLIKLCKNDPQTPARPCKNPPKTPQNRVKSLYVGIPVSPKFRPVSLAAQARLKTALGFPSSAPLIMVTGGSQGAVHLNSAIKQLLPDLLKFTSVGLVTGPSHLAEFQPLESEFATKNPVQSSTRPHSSPKNPAPAQSSSKNPTSAQPSSTHEKTAFHPWGYSHEMEKLLGAADLVVSRAGATTVAELAALEKAAVLVPFEKLPGGHQLKNAEALATAGAVAMLPDTDLCENPAALLKILEDLIQNPAARARLARTLHREIRTDAADRLATLILNLAEEKR